MWVFWEYWLILKLQILDLLVPNPPEKWLKGEKGDVLLIQGVNGKWNSFNKIGNKINKDGYKVHIVNELGYNLMPIRKGAEIVKKYILKYKLRNIIIVGHSKGSTIAKILFDDENIKDLIDRVYLICAPHQGSYLAYLNPFAWDLIPNKKEKIPILDDIQMKKIVNIYPRVDNHVIPCSSSHLDGVKNIQLSLCGHTLILESPELLKLIK